MKLLVKSPLFLLSFALIVLLNANYTILRSCRNTIALTCFGGSASHLPYFELFGTLPGSILMTALVSKLAGHLDAKRLFFLVLLLFLSFFLGFTFILYPFLSQLPPFVATLSSMLFYVMAELWKIIPFTVLFWGLLNKNMTEGEAKIFYGPLMLGGSLGTMLAGPLIVLCTTDTITTSWHDSLAKLTLLLTFSGALIFYLYGTLWQRFESRAFQEKREKKMSLKKSLFLTWNSPTLFFLGWIVLTDFLAYTLGEVIFLDLLKEKFPDPKHYCQFQGTLSFWVGILTTISALIFTPWMLKRTSWTAVALVTPIAVLLTEGAFFIVLRLHCNHPPLLNWAIFLGSLQYCLCRAAKYTFFDTSKELVFVGIDPSEKMGGKLAIDGIAARVGKGGASALTLLLSRLFGGVRASAPLAGLIALAFGGCWLMATLKLGHKISSTGSGTSSLRKSGDHSNPLDTAT